MAKSSWEAIRKSDMNQDQPPPYYEPMPPNMYGPQQYGNPPYMAPMPQSIIVSSGMVSTQQCVTVRRPTNHCGCFLICLLTGGLSVPCWIYACINID